MRKIIGMCLVALSVAMVLEAGKKPANGKIKVFVSAPAYEAAEEQEGFVTSADKTTEEDRLKNYQELQDSAGDIRKKLKKNDWVQLVATEEEADLTFEVIARSWRTTGAYTVSRYQQFIEVSELSKRSLTTIILVDGKVVESFQSDPTSAAMGGWGWRAGKMKDRLQDFVQENYDYILGLREETK